MPHCHCAKTMLGTLKVNPHCAVHGTEYNLGSSRVSQMGLTSNEKNVLNQVSKQLNAASKMHKGQADKLRNLGFAPKPKNLAPNNEPTYQDMSWFKGRVKTLHNNDLGYAGRVQLIGNIIPEIDGRTAGLFLTSAFVGNTLIAKALGEKWIESLDVGLMTTGLASAAAGALTAAKGIREEDTNLLAAGGALTGLGLFYYLGGRPVR